MSWGTGWGNPPVGDKPIFVGMDLAKPGSDITALTIPMKDAWPRTVKAKIIGDLAIHEHLDDPEHLQVTHVPTFKAFCCYPEGSTEDQLVSWCQKVQENLIEDWAELRKLTNLTYTDESANDCKLRIKEMCLKTGI